MKKLHCMLFALLFAMASCAEPGGDNPDITPQNIVEYAQLPESVAFEANFKAGDEVSFDLVVDAKDYTLAAEMIATEPIESPYFTTDVAAGKAKNGFAITLTATEAAEELVGKRVEKVALSLQYSAGKEALKSDSIEVIFPAMTNLPSFASQPDKTILFDAYFEAGDAVSTQFEVDLAGAKAEDIVVATSTPNDKVKLIVEPTTTSAPATFEVKFETTEAAVKAIEAARLDPKAVAQNNITNYTNLTLARKGMDAEEAQKSNLIKIVYTLDDIAPSFKEETLPTAEFLMNFRNDTTAVSTFTIDPGTKAIDSTSFAAKLNDNVEVTFEPSDKENEYRAIFTPTAEAVAKTEAFATECEIAIKYDDSLSISKKVAINFAADVEMWPTPIGEIGGALESNFELGKDVTIEFEINRGSYDVEASNFVVADNNYFTTTIEQGDQPNQFVMTLTTKQGAIDLSRSLSENKSLPSAMMLNIDGKVALFGMFSLVVPPSISLNMKMMSVASTAFVYRVEISGVDDENVVDKGVARTQDSTLAIANWAKWKHGATNLAYIGIRDKLTPGGTYRMCPFVQLKNGSIAYGDVQIVKTYASANDVPRIGNTRWYWDTPWFVADPSSKNHKDNDPTSADDPKAIAKKAMIEARMDSACYYYSVYCKRAKNISVMYKTSVGTANSIVTGNHINFGHSFGWSTGLHEISHSMGTGGNKFHNLFKDKAYTGANANRMLQEIENNRNKKIAGDTAHFWPYNMNYGDEYKSEADAIRHVMLIQAMINDGM